MKIKTLNEKIESINKQLRNLKIKKSNFNKTERKKRARNLIILGANFEILGYEKEENTVILGFLKENISKINENREYYKKIGQDLLDERAKARESLNETPQEKRQINSEEIKKLLILSKTYNISEFIQKELKKNLWEKLTFEEYQLILKNFEKEKS